MPEIDIKPGTEDAYVYARLARLDLAEVLNNARRYRHFFLAYLIKVVMAELRNIENGKPTSV